MAALRGWVLGRWRGDCKIVLVDCKMAGELGQVGCKRVEVLEDYKKVERLELLACKKALELGHCMMVGELLLDLV